MTSETSRRKARVLLAIVVVAGLALRVYVLVASKGYVDGDEAMVGLQSLDILRGHHSVFFAGELLAGSVESYLVVPFFWLLGPSSFTLRIVPVFFGILLVLMPLLLTRGLGKSVAIVAVAFTAVSPAMVFYSRYYIHEMLLVCFTFGAKTWLGHDARSRRWANQSSLLGRSSDGNGPITTQEG